MSIVRTEPSESLVPHKVIWVGLIVGLLLLQILMSAVAIFLATSDDATAIEQNYGTKSLQWDQAMAAKRASDSLGWVTTIDVPQMPDLYGQRKLRIVLNDRDGLPVEKATVQLSLFHHAHASRVQEMTMTPVPNDPGAYVADVSMRHGGLWELRINAKRGSDEYLLTEQREVP
jgi:nitrogen fixation protein FixH